MNTPTPAYILDESKLRRNLEHISNISRQTGTEIILALKAFAWWRTFPLLREYVRHTTASSLYEARLSFEHFGGLTHTYSPAYEEATFDDILRMSCHITFNSLSQCQRFMPRVRAFREHPVSCGLRINPQQSDITTLLYNPCAPGSRFGVTAADMPAHLPEGIEGFHFHCLCENDADSLQRVLQRVERDFAPWLPQLKWLNMGGGHLMTRQGYHTDLLIDTLQQFHQRHPHLQLLMEPGSAFLWQTGWLEASVVDIVENNGIQTALLNVSFTCHMPDCLEMPYHPVIQGARHIDEQDMSSIPAHTYRLGGNSCLSGDWMGLWQFPEKLTIGSRIRFEDMIHYTTVKTNMFNGVNHPSMLLLHEDGTLETLRSFTYEDYRDRMN